MEWHQFGQPLGAVPGVLQVLLQALFCSSLQPALFTLAPRKQHCCTPLSQPSNLHAPSWGSFSVAGVHVVLFDINVISALYFRYLCSTDPITSKKLSSQSLYFGFNNRTMPIGFSTPQYAVRHPTFSGSPAPSEYLSASSSRFSSCLLLLFRRLD